MDNLIKTKLRALKINNPKGFKIQDNINTTRATEAVRPTREDFLKQTTHADVKSNSTAVTKMASQYDVKSGDDPLLESDHPFRHPSETSDLRLMVEGCPLYVSKVVLSLVSPVFNRYDFIQCIHCLKLLT